MPRPHQPASSSRTGRQRNADPSISLLLKMLAIPGVSGQEGRISGFVQQQLIKSGADPAWLKSDQAHRRSPIGGEVGNLVLRLPGTIRARRRMLVAHLDTVPICAGCRPVVRGERIEAADPTTGLGADNRAGSTVLLHTAKRLLREKVDHPPLTFLWTVQEEVGLQGARLLNLANLGRPFCGFNWDGGSASKLTIGATGGYRMEITIKGIASHAGGAPERGVSAIAVAAHAIDQLRLQGWHGAIRKDEGVGTSNIGVIHGGTATNVVADAVQIRAEARSHEAAFRQQIVQQIQQCFSAAAGLVHNDQGATGSVAVEGRLDYEAFRLPADHPAVELARAAVADAGGEAELAIANGGLDANWLTARGIPTVTLGCGQSLPHTVDETLEIDQFRRACEIAWRLATGREVARN